MSDLPHKFSHGFYQVCGDKMVIGGGQGLKSVLNEVIEWQIGGGWKNLPKLIEGRKSAASCYVENRLLVAGGKNDKDRISTIEILEDAAKESPGTMWKKCISDLPNKLEGHTLTPLNNAVYLIGGHCGAKDRALFKKVWKGNIKFKRGQFDLDFEEVRPSMRIPRWNHFAISVKDKIYVFGGEMEGKVSEVEIFDGKAWETGPQFDCLLNRQNGDGAVWCKGDVIIITSKSQGIILYDPTKRTIKPLKSQELEDERCHYVIFSN